MKTWRIIILIALAVFGIARLASTCEQRKNTKLKEDFSQRINSIEIARSNIFPHQDTVDSLQLEADQVKLYDLVVDSNIEYYRDIYSADEKRNKQYLKVIYEYKKLYYEYNALLDFKANHLPGKEKKEKEYQEIQQNIRSISMDLRSYKLSAMWDIFD